MVVPLERARLLVATADPVVAVHRCLALQDQGVREYQEKGTMAAHPLLMEAAAAAALVQWVPMVLPSMKLETVEQDYPPRSLAHQFSMPVAVAAAATP